MSTAQTPKRALALPDFLHDEAAGGIVLVVGALVAVVWANSPVSESYTDFWGQYLTLGWGPTALTENLQHWVNDGLMVVFFFVVGLRSSASWPSANCRTRALRRFLLRLRWVASSYRR